MSEKLEEFHLFTFNEFLGEILKKSSVKLSLKDQDEWEKYFNKNKNNLLKLSDEITKVDLSMNDIVYKMYDITTWKLKNRGKFEDG